ncbi:hypothetical protein [Aeromicrobium alkaliterrae]|uniref:Uncharacterized protein n=1 Tax=Aeromicrobium alkaliterrae TaxID=302168 RepID=A0ABN2JLQ9_9ACTN
MAQNEYDATPRELRNFALLQIVLTAGFLAVLFVMLGGTDAERPHWAVWVGLLAAVALGGILADRVWLSAEPLDPAADAEENRTAAVGVFAAQTVRKLLLCEAPMLIAVVVAFVTDSGGWPIAIAGLPGLIVMSFEIWPSLRNVSMTETMLNAEGAESDLIDSFV